MGLQYTQLDVLDIVGCRLEDACLVMELPWLLFVVGLLHLFKPPLSFFSEVLILSSSGQPNQ